MDLPVLAIAISKAKSLQRFGLRFAGQPTSGETMAREEGTADWRSANPSVRPNTPPAEAWGGRSDRPPICLTALQVDQFGQHFVRYRDDPGIGLESPLGGDHVGKLFREVDVG